MGGFLGKVFGSGKTRTGIERMSPEELKRLEEIEGELTKLLGGQQPGQAERSAFEAETAPLAEAFKTLLTDTVQKQMGDPQAAREYVQATFTRPAEERLRQFTSDFENQQRARAASLGRDPNIDYETNRGIYSELARQQANLAAEESARVAQRPQELAQLGLQGLGGLQQRSAFLTDLGQRAMENRLNLLNARTGIGDAFFRERASQRFQKGPTPGAFGYFTTVKGYFDQEAQNAAKTAGSILPLFGSDERIKENIEPISTYEFLDNLSPYKFNYKNNAETNYGIIAQDLEKSEIGKSCVMEQDGIKYVITHKAISALLASNAALHKRIKQLEEKANV